MDDPFMSMNNQPKSQDVPREASFPWVEEVAGQ
jgi:hypothetical protein